MLEKNNNYKKYCYIGALVAVLGVVFAGQQGYFDGIGKTASAAVSGYWAKGSNWVIQKAYPTISNEVQSRGEGLGNEINSVKENISENVLEKAGDYLSGIKNSIVNPGSNSCQASDESVSESSQ